MGISNVNYDNKFNLLGTSITNNTINLNNTNYNISVSSTNLQTRDDLLQNEIDAIVITQTEAGNLDALYGVSIAVLDGRVGQTIGISLPNLGISINTNDVNFRSYKFSNDTLTSLLGTSISNHTTTLNNIGTTLISFDTDINTLFNNENILGVSVNQNTTDINNLYDISSNLTITSSNITEDINEVKSFLQGEIDTKADESDLTTLEGVVGALDTAFTAFDTAQTAYNFANENWKAIQDANNSYQQLELDGVDDRLDDHDGQLEILTTFKDDMLGTTMPQFLTRNETTLPSSFNIWTGNNTKTLTQMTLFK